MKLSPLTRPEIPDSDIDLKPPELAVSEEVAPAKRPARGKRADVAEAPTDHQDQKHRPRPATPPPPQHPSPGGPRTPPPSPSPPSSRRKPAPAPPENHPPASAEGAPPPRASSFAEVCQLLSRPDTPEARREELLKTALAHLATTRGNQTRVRAQYLYDAAPIAYRRIIIHLWRSRLIYVENNRVDPVEVGRVLDLLRPHLLAELGIDDCLGELELDGVLALAARHGFFDVLQMAGREKGEAPQRADLQVHREVQAKFAQFRRRSEEKCRAAADRPRSVWDAWQRLQPSVTQCAWVTAGDFAAVHGRIAPGATETVEIHNPHGERLPVELTRCSEERHDGGEIRQSKLSRDAIIGGVVTPVVETIVAERTSDASPWHIRCPQCGGAGNAQLYLAPRCVVLRCTRCLSGRPS